MKKEHPRGRCSPTVYMILFHVHRVFDDVGDDNSVDDQLCIVIIPDHFGFDA